MKVYLRKHGLLRSATKESNGVKSHDLGRQLISPRREITLPYFSNAIFARVVWFLASSCCNHISSKSYSSIRDKKNRLSYNAPNWRWQSFHRGFLRIKVQSHLRNKERTKQWLQFRRTIMDFYLPTSLST